MITRPDACSVSIPDVVPGSYLLSPEAMRWEPVEAAGIHSRALVCKPILTGAAIGLWLKYSDPQKTGFITYDHDHPLAGENNGFYAKLDYLRQSIIGTNPETGQQSTHHILRTIGRVLLHQDRYKKWSLPLSLKNEELMVPRPNAPRGAVRTEEFMVLAHDLNMNLNDYAARAVGEQEAA